MNQTPDKVSRYVLGGIAVLCLFIILGWFALREGPSSVDQQPVKTEPTKPHARHVATAFEPADDLSSEEPTNRPNDSVATNAAVIYRQAFDLFNALSNEQKNIVGDWRTNVDAAVEAELCEKLRPICDLMHQASAVTNCDWGVEPITVDTKWTHLTPARNIARAALWNAAHCRSNDVTGAADDAMAVLRLGQTISRGAMIGCLVDMALQGMTSSYVAQNVGLFNGAAGQQLATAFDDPAYDEAPSRAMQQEADMVESLGAKLASLSDAEMKKEWPTEKDRADLLAAFKHIADLDRKLAGALASSKDEDEAWQQYVSEGQAFGPVAKLIFQAADNFVDRVRRAEVNRAMVVAGLAVAENGTEALAAHLDPASGKPFVYTKTDNGFELQSSYQLNDKPMKMQFK
jgi:hypothetical protein